MILVDTSIWIDYFRGSPRASPLSQLLEDHRVFSHPWVVGELMLGQLGPLRNAILQDLEWLPQLGVYSITELRDFIEREKLQGKGLSLVDAQFLYSTLLEGCSLWTYDKKLRTQAKYYNVDY